MASQEDCIDRTPTCTTAATAVTTTEDIVVITEDASQDTQDPSHTHPSSSSSSSPSPSSPHHTLDTITEEGILQQMEDLNLPAPTLLHSLDAKLGEESSSPLLYDITMTRSGRYVIVTDCWNRCLKAFDLTVPGSPCASVFQLQRECPLCVTTISHPERIVVTLHQRLELYVLNVHEEEEEHSVKMCSEDAGKTAGVEMVSEDVQKACDDLERTDAGDRNETEHGEERDDVKSEDVQNTKPNAQVRDDGKSGDLEKTDAGDRNDLEHGDERDDVKSEDVHNTPQNDTQERDDRKSGDDLEGTDAGDRNETQHGDERDSFKSEDVQNTQQNDAQEKDDRKSSDNLSKPKVLSFHSIIATTCNYRGISTLDSENSDVPERLVLTLPKEIHVTSLQGEILQVIAPTLCGLPLLEDVIYITTTPSHTLVISDMGARRVLCLSLSGRLHWLHPSLQESEEEKQQQSVRDAGTDLQPDPQGQTREAGSGEGYSGVHWPLGVAADSQGRVFVCDLELHSVVLLSSGGAAGRLLLTQTQTLQFPRGLFISHGCLCLTQDDCIKVFSMS